MPAMASAATRARRAGAADDGDPETSNKGEYTNQGGSATAQTAMRAGNLIMNTVKLNKYGRIHMLAEANIKGISRHSWPHTFHNNFVPKSAFREIGKTIWSNEDQIAGVLIEFWGSERFTQGHDHAHPRHDYQDPCYDKNTNYGFDPKACMTLNCLNFPMKVQPSKNLPTNALNMDAAPYQGVPLHAGNLAVAGNVNTDDPFNTSTDYLTQGTGVSMEELVTPPRVYVERVSCDIEIIMKSFNNNLFNHDTTSILAVAVPMYTDFRVLLVRGAESYIKKYGQQPEFATDLFLNPGGPQEIPWRTNRSEANAPGVHWATGWCMGSDTEPMQDYTKHIRNANAGTLPTLPILPDRLPAPLIGNQRAKAWNPGASFVESTAFPGHTPKMQGAFGPTCSDIMTHPINRGAYEVLADEKFTLAINTPGSAPKEPTSRRLRFDFPVNSLVEFAAIPASFTFTGFSDQLALGAPSVRWQFPTTAYAQKLQTGHPRLLILASGPGARSSASTTAQSGVTQYDPKLTWQVRTRGNTTYRDTSTGPGIRDNRQVVKAGTGFDPTGLVTPQPAGVHGHGTLKDDTVYPFIITDNQ